MIDIEKARNFFIIQKIKVLEIKKTPMGSFDVFDIYPEFGTKTSKLSKSIEDFALYMGCLGIPEAEFDFEKGYFRVKLQKREVGTLLLSEGVRLASPDMLSPIALGSLATGLPLIIDQGAVPNTLIAGAPGSGKSTLLKVMIESLLYSDVAVTIIDPKIVDFISYKNRSRCVVESDPSKFIKIFESEINRMNLVYSMLSKRGFSSVAENNRLCSDKINPHVIIVDEWADVYHSDKKCLEKVLTLSQKGRAAGISIIISTQRPSASILPGQIKANFTGRIAMRVSSDMESRIIMNSSVAANIREPGMGYYMDQNYSQPVYFRTAKNDLPKNDIKKNTSFWSSIKATFKI